MTMVERMARANYDRRQQIGWECGIAPTSWEDAGPSTRAMERDCARAALSAMMDVTPGMVEAGLDYDERELNIKFGRPPTVEECQAGEWKAMCRAALDEGAE